MTDIAVITGASAGVAYLAIFADKFASPLLDRHLASGNIEAQQDPAPLSPNRSDNLFAPVDDDEDHGTHGRFDKQSRTSSPLLWASEHRAWLAAGAALVAGAGLVAARTEAGERK